MNLCNDNKGILNANVKDDENFEDEDFMNEEIDPLDIGFQDENYKSCFNIRVKSEGNEDFVEAKDELLLVEDGLVLEGFGGQSTNGSNECEDINVVKEELPVFANYILEEDNCQPADECEYYQRPSTSTGRKYVDRENRMRTTPTNKMVEESSKCGEFSLRLKGRSAFRRHSKMHKKRSFGCDVCSKVFLVKQSLKHHMRIHTGEKTFHCNICHKGFSLSGSLENHLRTHTGEKPFQCDVCHKGFAQSGTLVRHLRTHTGEQPFQCDVCHKGFAQSAHLVYHMRTHTLEKPFQCDVCHKGFAQSSHLVDHLRTHSGEKPFQCDICHKRFAQNGNLARHLRTHTEEKPF